MTCFTFNSPFSFFSNAIHAFHPVSSHAAFSFVLGRYLPAAYSGGAFVEWMFALTRFLSSHSSMYPFGLLPWRQLLLLQNPKELLMVIIPFCYITGPTPPTTTHGVMSALWESTPSGFSPFLNKQSKCKRKIAWVTSWLNPELSAQDLCFSDSPSSTLPFLRESVTITVRMSVPTQPQLTPSWKGRDNTLHYSICHITDNVDFFSCQSCSTWDLFLVQLLLSAEIADEMCCLLSFSCFFFS